MIWRWDKFVIFCVILIFVSWVCGFFMSRWVTVAIGAVTGFCAGAQQWFEEAIPRRSPPPESLD